MPDEKEILTGLVEGAKEPDLEDDYLIHFGYLYVGNKEGIGWAVMQARESTTALESKMRYGLIGLKRCDIGARNLWGRMV